MQRSMSSGALAGMAATVPMTLTMVALRHFPKKEDMRMPMEQVAHNLLKKVKVYRELDDSDRDSFTWLTHFAFGAAAGAVFPFLTAKKEKHAALKGVGLGLTVWATSYIAALPALDIMPAPTRQPKQHVALEVVAHVVWGGCARIPSRTNIGQAS